MLLLICSCASIVLGFFFSCSIFFYLFSLSSFFEILFFFNLILHQNILWFENHTHWLVGNKVTRAGLRSLIYSIQDIQMSIDANKLNTFLQCITHETMSELHFESAMMLLDYAFLSIIYAILTQFFYFLLVLYLLLCL